MNKTEEQIAKEKEAVVAMRNARDNMKAVLERVATLEVALAHAIEQLQRTKDWVPKSAYSYNSNNTIHQTIDGYVIAAQTALGKR